jgi:beta-glucanase (GH16 family)
VWIDAGVLAGTKTIVTLDLSAAFHKYAVKWEATKQTFYLDGKVVYTVNVAMPDPMYIMLDLWYGSASGAADATTPVGITNSYEVNYVRAWKLS